MTTEQKNLLIHVNPIDAYKTFIVNEDLQNTHRMLSRTAANALRVVNGITTKGEIIASQQALYMMLNLEMI